MRFRYLAHMHAATAQIIQNVCNLTNKVVAAQTHEAGAI